MSRAERQSQKDGGLRCYLRTFLALGLVDACESAKVDSKGLVFYRSHRMLAGHTGGEGMVVQRAKTSPGSGP